MKTLVIIPAYNEELNIEATVKDVTNNTNYDYVIVNKWDRTCLWGFVTLHGAIRHAHNKVCFSKFVEVDYYPCNKQLTH